MNPTAQTVRHLDPSKVWKVEAPWGEHWLEADDFDAAYRAMQEYVCGALNDEPAMAKLTFTQGRHL